MSDKELKKIIEETVGNNDPYWNEPAFNIVKKIIDLPENAETSIYKLCDNLIVFSPKCDDYVFWCGFLTNYELFILFLNYEFIIHNLVYNCNSD